MTTAETYRAFSFGFWRDDPGGDPGIDHTGPVGLEMTPTGFSMVDGADSVRQALLLLLATAPGERVMRPTFGCDLHRLVFMPNDDTTAGLAMHYVRQAVERWEPRVDVLRVDAGRRRVDPDVSRQVDDPAGNRLYVTMDYRLRQTGRADRVSVTVDLGGGNS